MGNAKPWAGQAFRYFLMIVAAALLVVAYPLAGRAAPYADYVIDARTGEVLHETNANTRLHPASLTKMMTLYIAFEAVKRGEITLDTMVTVSRNAASEPPSRLGLRPGQKIALRYLIRAAAVRSANDAATAIGEAIGGSEEGFAARMNRTAEALGMTRTTFHNANGLTREGHLSTARDMAILGRRLFYDHPEYYNIFSRRSTDAGVATVANTNRRFLDAYEGADGIKTGYTSAAGFNLVASARRGDERIIAAVFGGTSTSQRNARMAELLDIGFRRAPSRAPVRLPAPPDYRGALVADAGAARGSGLVTRSPRPPARPVAAPPEAVVAALRNGIDDALASLTDDVEDIADAPAAEGATVLAAVTPPARPAEGPGAAPPLPDGAAVADDGGADAVAFAAGVGAAPDEANLAAAVLAALGGQPVPRAAIAPDTAGMPEAAAAPPAADAPPPAAVVPGIEAPVALADGAGAAPGADDGAGAAPPDEQVALAALPEATLPPAAAAPPPGRPGPEAGDDGAAPATPQAVAVAPEVAAPDPAAHPAAPGPVAEPRRRVARAPAPRPEVLAAALVVAAPAAPVVVERLSSSGGRLWGINLGRFPTRFDAERVLLRTALAEARALDGGLRKVVPRGGGFDAQFAGLTQEQADLACRRLQAGAQTCFTLAP